MTPAGLIKRYIQNTLALRQTGTGLLKIVRLYCQQTFLVHPGSQKQLLVWQLLFWAEQNTSVPHFSIMDPVAV